MSQDILPTNPEKPLGGRYQIINKLGAGGFGRTFLAEDLHLPGHPQCVVKQLKPQTSEPETLAMARRLFDTEAEVLYQLGNHDQIPRLLAHFEDNEEFYLAQEFIEGEPLTKEFAKGQPWTESQVIDLLQDILQVLAFVHEQQVIHRDIKPPNLIRRQGDGKIVLIDFGAVKQVSSQVVNPETGETNLTISIGTKGYMPNEQLAGTPRFSSDVYAVGMLGIQALTGVHPKSMGEDPQTGEMVWREHAPHVSPELAGILDKMVCYDFRDRYPTAADALAALQNLLGSRQDSLLITSSSGLKDTLPSQKRQPTPDELALAEELTEVDTNLGETNIWVPTEFPVQSSEDNHDTTVSLFRRQPSVDAPQTRVPPKTKLRLIPRQWVKLWPWLAVLTAVGVTFVVTKTVFSPQFAGRAVNRSGVLADQPSTPTPTQPTTPKPPPRKLTAEELQKEGERLKAAGKYQEALTFYDQAIALKPKFAEAYGGRCYCLNKLEKFSEAMVACNDALDLKPKYPEAMWGKGNAYQQQKRLTKALALYEQAIIKKPKFAEAWVSRGMVLQSLGRSYEALWAVDRAIDLERNSADAWTTKGEALWELGRWDEAIVALDKALELQPNHPEALKLRQQARKEMGR
ncbi:protein kinase domain-containing protein [Allocoleopsis franciscana]|uniref:non-specific serine/threonine protein kinase n=1 Tax=Allocoleopsis franciscana PCC 7113 TaxID=1173027 RepID=K9WD64_9CYAN|nr:serine/threonine-protein kinase [Allocoleopsis franciscana]AFZ18153.1 serine/threonine protein kinase [Allocoleopsis franciscana PCC 7113]